MKESDMDPKFRKFGFIGTTSDVKDWDDKPGIISLRTRPGRMFLRQMIETAGKAHKPNHCIRLNRSFNSGLIWWKYFLQVWNGRSMMEIHMTGWDPEIEFYSDALGLWGCGSVCLDKWL